MSISSQNYCQHSPITFPGAFTFSVPARQQAFFEEQGTKIEESLKCPSCSPQVHKDLKKYLKQCTLGFLKDEQPVYMLSQPHNISELPKQATQFLTQHELNQTSSLVVAGNGAYYNCQETTESYSITQDTLKSCKELIFNNPLQKNALVREGCYAKAEHACRLLLDVGLTTDQVFKLFYYPKKGNTNISIPKGGKIVCWEYHVVAAIKDENSEIYVLDPAIYPEEYLLLADWYLLIGGKNKKITLLTKDDLSSVQRKDTEEYIFKVPFNEYLTWLNTKPLIMPYLREDSHAHIAYLNRCHLRKTLKSHPNSLVALVAAPYTTLLKATFANKDKLCSEAELNHHCAMKKLEKSLQSDTFFMTKSDIKQIEPSFFDSKQKRTAAFQKLTGLHQLLLDQQTIDMPTKQILKTAIIKKIDEFKDLFGADGDDKAKQHARAKKHTSYSKWIFLFESKQSKRCVITSIDRHFYENISEKLRGLNHVA